MAGIEIVLFGVHGEQCYFTTQIIHGSTQAGHCNGFAILKGKGELFAKLKYFHVEYI